MKGVTAVPSPEAWQAEGKQVRLGSGESELEIFVHESGSGPTVTMLHGFPTSSLEWAGVIGEVEAGNRVIAPDFLGFGFSDKPDVDYSIALQADLIETLWEDLGIQSGALVGYDYGGMVVMELLARHREGRLAFRPDRVVLLNSALFSDTYSPRLLTRLMAAGPLSGLLGKAMNEKTVTRSWSEVFSDGHPLDPGVASVFWEILQRDGDSRELRRLLHFVPERAANANRWDEALTATEVPISLVWGVEDLVSGSDAGLIPERLPRARLSAMDGVGHAPHMEVPSEAGPLLATALGSGRAS